jgi:para-aminobenzoate synthetase / 4-amino-4-deoxychorismate lyase
MEILRQLEDSPRGAYCGAIGYFAPAPEGRFSAHFNVAIRTLTIAGAHGSLGIGGGVVQDSDAAAEYAECLLKARFFVASRPPLQLIETLRFESGFVRLERHLARMAESAHRFGLTFDPVRARSVLSAAVTGRDGPLRVRLTLDETGNHGVAATALEPDPPHWTYRLSLHQVRSTDLLQRHKTSWRELYEREAGLADEVFFCNERGELTEGARSNIFVERDGVLLTPSLEAGALGGCLRAELLAQGRAREAMLTPQDLKDNSVYCGNSLRGLIRALPL